MRRIRFQVAYDGTAFHGWQVQPGFSTIQGELEAVLLEIERAPVHVAGSGRTDAGVHALGQVAAISIGNRIPLPNLRKAMNRLLPDAIRVDRLTEVAPEFHPRFDARSKTYEYRIYTTEVCSPFERRYVHYHPFPLQEGAMREAAPVLIGEHDFSAFSAADDRDEEAKSQVRRIFQSELVREGERLVYRVSGSGFLKHMVRNIAGTLIEAGKGNVDAERMRRHLREPSPKAGPRAPACGLFLMRVDYE